MIPIIIVKVPTIKNHNNTISRLHRMLLTTALALGTLLLLVTKSACSSNNINNNSNTILL